jgi:hypothetical protein
LKTEQKQKVCYGPLPQDLRIEENLDIFPTHSNTYSQTFEFTDSQASASKGERLSPLGARGTSPTYFHEGTKLSTICQKIFFLDFFAYFVP